MTAKEFEDSGIVLLGLPYGAPDHKDLQGDYFTPETDFGPLKEVVAYFSHANPLDEKALEQGLYDQETHQKLSLNPIGKAVVEKETDEGVLYRIMFDKAYRYKNLIKRLYTEGLLGASSTPFQKTVEKQADGKITKWHVIEVGPTLSAANPDTLPNLKEIFKSIREDEIIMPEEIKTEPVATVAVEKEEAVATQPTLAETLTTILDAPKEAAGLSEVMTLLGQVMTELAGIRAEQKSLEEKQVQIGSTVGEIREAMPLLATGIAKSLNLNSFERGARTDILEKQIQSAGANHTTQKPAVALNGFAGFPGSK